MRNKKSSIDDLLKAATETKKTYDNEKVEVWQCKQDKLGNGSAVIRFLSTEVIGEPVPWAKIFSHGFKNPDNNRWYIENSLSTIGKPDPMGEYNNTLYATKDLTKIEQAKAQKRKLNFFSNILVVKDPENPQNEGKVFLYRYPQKVHTKLVDAMKPNNEGLDADDWTQPVDPFSPFEGCNVNLRIKKVGGWPNYDETTMGKQKPLASSDEEIEEILKQCQSLTALSAPDKFRTYAELQKKIAYVFGEEKRHSASDIADSIGKEFEAVRSIPKGLDAADNDDFDSDEDADAKYFRELANS